MGSMAIEPVNLGTTLELPSSITTDEDKLRALLRLQQMQIVADFQHLDAGADEKTRLAYITAQRPKLFSVARDIITVRGREFKRLGVGPMELDGSSHPWDAIKGEGRAEKKWDGELAGHPVLSIAAAEGPILDPFEVLDPGLGDYVEVDVPGRLSYTGNFQVDITALEQDEEVYLTKDYGAAFFTGPFTHYSIVHLDSAVANTTSFGFAAESDTAVDYKNGGNYNGGLMFAASGNDERIFGFHSEGGTTQDSDSWLAAAPATDYYIERSEDSGTTSAMLIRTGSHAGALQDTLGWDDDGDARQYSHAVSSADNAIAGRPISGHVRDIDLQLTGFVFRRHQMDGGMHKQTGGSL